MLLAAFDGETVVGTVQVLLSFPPNQPHRGEIAKLLVHRSARKRGVAQALMARAEQEARDEGKTLLVLDTVTGDPAERLYTRLGWTTGRRHPRLCPLPGRAPLRHDRLLESGLSSAAGAFSRRQFPDEQRGRTLPHPTGGPT